jgi:hypothetical protein
MSTMTEALDRRARVETLLSPFEQRSVTVDRETILARRDGAALGHELNRLQGAAYTDIDARLDRLWRNGQVSKAEYVQLVTDLARQGLIEASPDTAHGR